MLNDAKFQGRTVNEIEERMTSTGRSVCSFTLAVARSYVKKGEERQTDWIDCIAWGETAGALARNVRKGAMIIVEGPMQTSNYEDKDGNKRKAVECVVQKFHYCEKKGDGNQISVPEIQDGYSTATEEDFKEIPTGDDLPF